MTRVNNNNFVLRFLIFNITNHFSFIFYFDGTDSQTAKAHDKTISESPPFISNKKAAKTSAICPAAVLVAIVRFLVVFGKNQRKSPFAWVIIPSIID